MKKNKFFIFSFVAIILTSLTGCNKKMESAHDKQGFTQKVVYNLGEGKYIADNRDTNELVVWYKPGTNVADLSSLNKYNKSFSYPGYELTGWYMDETLTQKMDFDNYLLPEQSSDVVTIYAKWEEIIETNFVIYYVDEEGVYENTSNLKWNANTPFEYSKDKVQSLFDSPHTYLGAYTDVDLTKEVDDTYLLSKNNNNLPIYTKWITGEYVLISNAKDFKSYFGKRNLYITNDLDLTGINIDVDTMINKTILGNNHTITNFTFTTDGKENSKNTAYCGGLVNQQIKGCVIKDLNIVDAKYEISSNTCSIFYFGLLAGKVIDSTIENVKISGELTYSKVTKNHLNDGKLKILRLNLDAVGYEITNTTVNECEFNVINMEEE